MTTDTELKSWQQEWRENTEPMPELKKKIKRQNQQTAAAIVAVLVCLAISTERALRTHSAFMIGAAAGIAFAGVLLGGYAWWVKRGSWKPTAQTTLAYAQLSYQRAIARTRILNFAFYFLLITAILFAGFLAWNWKHAHQRDAIVGAMMVAEIFYIKKQGQRKQLVLLETKKLLDDIRG